MFLKPNSISKVSKICIFQKRNLRLWTIYKIVKTKKVSLWYVVKVVFRGICSLNNFMDKIKVLNICFQDTF